MHDEPLVPLAGKFPNQAADTECMLTQRDTILMDFFNPKAPVWSCNGISTMNVSLPLKHPRINDRLCGFTWRTPMGPVNGQYYFADARHTAMALSRWLPFLTVTFSGAPVFDPKISFAMENGRQQSSPRSCKLTQARLSYAQWNGWYSYHAMQVQVRKTMSHGFQIQLQLHLGQEY